MRKEKNITDDKGLRRARGLSALSLMLEESGRSFWRALCWISFFAALWLLDIPAQAGTAGPVVTLLIFSAGCFWFGRRALKDFRWPSATGIDRRIEDYNRLRHRPLALVSDSLANPQDEETRSLWQDSIARAAQTLKNLRAPPPRPVLSDSDPYGLRILTALLLVAGLAIAGPAAGDRLAYGLTPLSIRWQDRINDNIVLWITPPAYTRLATATLQGGGTLAEPLSIAQDSVLKLRVRKGWGTPVLYLDNRRLDMTAAEDGSWGLETKVDSQVQELKISQFFLPRLRVPVTYIPDTPPVISSVKAEPLPKGALQIPMTVSDDYGLTGLTMRMTLDPAIDNPPLGTPLSETKTLTTPGGTQDHDIKPVFDTAWHPWAGLPVVITLEAADARGQIGPAPEQLKLELPERTFHHPVAAALIDMRKRLIWSPVTAAKNVARELENLLYDPMAFGGDHVVFLSIRSASSHLRLSPTQETALTVIPQLWDTALRIEDGNLSFAARQVQQAKDALEKLLQDPQATDEQIAQAMDELRQAMANYFQEMFNELQRRMADGSFTPPALSPEDFAGTLDGDALRAFLDQLQTESMSGNRDKAQEMLSQLQQMMDMMNPGLSMEMPPQMKALQEDMNALKDIIDRQKDLIGRTTDAVESANPYAPPIPPAAPQEDMPPPPQDRLAQNTPDTKPLSGEQDKVRLDLGEVMRQAGEQRDDIPENLQKAEQAMRAAVGALNTDDPAAAVPAQEEALKHLQDSQQQMQQQMMAMMKQMSVMSFGMGPLDPLGRPVSPGEGPSWLPGTKVKIPDEAQRKKVQEILDTLRRKAGEHDRPAYERDYYRRLMRQF